MKRTQVGWWLQWTLAGILCAALPAVVGCEDDDDDDTSATPTVVTNVVVVGNKTNVVVATNAPPVVQPSVLNVAGKWNGAVTLNGVTRHLDMTLTQNGAGIGGTFQFSTGLKGSVSGTLSGDHLVLKLLPITALSPDFYTKFDGNVNAGATEYIGSTTSMPDGANGSFALQK